ncbi:MAG: hypothetical protein QW692_06185 [Nitrososphaerota archaeon]
MMNQLKVLNIFLGSRAERGWPSPNYDYERRAGEITQEFNSISSSLNFPISFENAIVSSLDELSRLEREIGEDIDAIFAHILTSESTRYTYWACRRIADFGYDYIHKSGGYGIPVVYVVDLYGGDISALPLIEDLSKLGRRFLVISSSKSDDLIKALKVVYTIKMLRQSRILLITRRDANPVKYLNRSYMDKVRERFGVSIEYVDYSDVKRLYDAVDGVEAEKIAEDIMKGALEIKEVSRDDVVKAVRMYLALKELLRSKRANSLAIDCLGWLEYKKMPLPITPCIALSLLNDEGYVAACEADVHSALSMLIFRYLAGVPSFISDPVVDMGTNTVIHCHCTAPRLMDGKNRSPYKLRSHADGGGGVSLQVYMKEGESVTVGKFIQGLDVFVVARGKILGNIDVDRGCRTKVATSVEDAKKYLYEYRGGLHRVLAYGDHIALLEDLGKLLGFNVELEGE